MTVVTARPNATIIGGSGTPVEGAASIHAALNDDSDSSYIRFVALSEAVVGLDEPSLPSGAVPKTLALRARTARTTNNANFQAAAYDGVGVFADYSLFTVSWTSPTTTVVNSRPITSWPSDLRAYVRQTSGGDNWLRCYEVYVDLTYVERPEVTVTGPVGTVGDTTEPTITWTRTLDSDGGAQTRYQARVFTEAQYTAGGFDAATASSLVDSGEVSSDSLSWPVTSSLVDGNYRAYVRVAQTVNGSLHWSDWEYIAFSIDVQAPDPPALTLTPNAELGRVEVTVIAASDGPVPATHLQVQRYTAGGWQNLRLLDDTGLIVDSETQVADYEMTLNAEESYRARALRAYGTELAGSTWTTGTVTLATRQWWLKNPLDPDANVPVTIAGYAEQQREARSGVFQPLGRRDQVVVGDTRGAAQGRVVLRVDTVADRTALNALLDQAGTYLLHGPVEDAEPDRYVRFTDEQVTRLADKSFVVGWDHELTWHEVDSPSGVVAAFPGLGFWTIGEMEAFHAADTLEEMEADYITLYEFEHVEAD